MTSFGRSNYIHSVIAPFRFFFVLARIYGSPVAKNGNVVKGNEIWSFPKGFSSRSVPASPDLLWELCPWTPNR